VDARYGDLVTEVKFVQLVEQLRCAAFSGGWSRMPTVGVKIVDVRRNGLWSRLGCCAWAVSSYLRHLRTAADWLKKRVEVIGRHLQ
jgi:hypothetical protein